MVVAQLKLIAGTQHREVEQRQFLLQLRCQERCVIHFGDASRLVVVAVGLGEVELQVVHFRLFAGLEKQQDFAPALGCAVATETLVQVLALEHVRSHLLLTHRATDAGYFLTGFGNLHHFGRRRASRRQEVARRLEWRMPFSWFVV